MHLLFSNQLQFGLFLDIIIFSKNKMFTKICVVLCTVLAVASSQNDFSRDCDVGYSVKCLKLDIVSYIEKLSNKEEFNVLPGVSVIREANSNENKTSEIVSGNLFSELVFKINFFYHLLFYF